MEEKSYYIYESDYEPTDGTGIISTNSIEGAWEEFGDYLWNYFKGTDTLYRFYGTMYQLPPDMDAFETDVDNIDITKCTLMSTKSFCIPPHAPKCYNGRLTRDSHEWNEDLTKPLEKSEWEGCLDYSIPCKYCNISKTIRVGEVPINGNSKITPVKYDTRSLLHGEKIITSEPKSNFKVPELSNNTRVCGVCAVGDEEVFLFYADDDKDAILMAEWLMRRACRSLASNRATFGKYYLAVAPVCTKIDDEIFTTDLLEGKWIAEDVVYAEPMPNRCVGKDHIWSNESYVVSTIQVRFEGQYETDAVKYCKVKTCNIGKIIRVGIHETLTMEYINLCQDDVDFKDKLTDANVYK